MSSAYRQTRPNSYLARIAESLNSTTVLAPDITTARNPKPAPATQAPVPARPPTLRAARSGEGSIIEERHPEIARAISLLWGFAEMNEYFDRLWIADGMATPIDPDAMSELMLLSRVHHMIVPQRPGRTLAQIYGSSRLHESSGSTRDPWRDVPPRR